MYTHHGLDHEFARGTRARVAFMVCAVPRSGSSLLCDVLASTELAGAPTEYFDAETLARYAERWGVGSFDAYLRELRARKTTPNGVFGFKAHYPQLASYFGARDVLREFSGLSCIYVRRADRVAQAVSLYRASHTEQWAAHQVARKAPPPFDFAAIVRHRAAIDEQEGSWERFFSERGVTPLRVEYAELVRDYAGTLRAVLEFLGVQVPRKFAAKPPTLARQADDWSRRCVQHFEWCELYGADLAAAPPAIRERAFREQARESRPAHAATPDVSGFLDEVREEPRGLHVTGWLLIDAAPADAIELVAGSGAATPASRVERADLARAFPRASDAAGAGFEAWLARADFAQQGAWSFTLRAKRGAQVAFECRVRALASELGPTGAAGPSVLGRGEIRVHCSPARA